MCEHVNCHQEQRGTRRTGSSNADGLGDGQDLRVLQQTGVGSKPGIDSLARSQEAESVPAAVAVAGRGNLVDAARVEVGHRLGDDGIDGRRAVKQRPGGRVEAGRGQVRGRRVVIEHVRRHGQVARSCKRVGETDARVSLWCREQGVLTPPEAGECQDGTHSLFRLSWMPKASVRYTTPTVGFLQYGSVT